MKDLPKRLYETIDSTLMYGTNKLVKAWNWTTGRTKTDLAKTLIATGFGVAAIGAINGKTFYDIPVYATVGYCAWGSGNMLEKAEQQTQESDVCSLVAEILKNHAKTTGPLVIILGTQLGLLKLVASNKPISEKITDVAFNVGYCFLGAAYYVMRADNPPPRKNVVRRTASKLKEFLQKPALQPVVVTPYSLEERM